MPAVKTSADLTVLESVRNSIGAALQCRPCSGPWAMWLPCGQKYRSHHSATSCHTLKQCSTGALQPDVHPGANQRCALTASFQQGSSRLCRAQADCGAAQPGPDRQVRLPRMAASSDVACARNSGPAPPFHRPHVAMPCLQRAVAEPAPVRCPAQHAGGPAAACHAMLSGCTWEAASVPARSLAVRYADAGPDALVDQAEGTACLAQPTQDNR